MQCSCIIDDQRAIVKTGWGWPVERQKQALEFLHSGQGLRPLRLPRSIHPPTCAEFFQRADYARQEGQLVGHHMLLAHGMLQSRLIGNRFHRIRVIAPENCGPHRGRDCGDQTLPLAVQ